MLQVVRKGGCHGLTALDGRDGRDPPNDDRDPPNDGRDPPNDGHNPPYNGHKRSSAALLQ